MYGGVCACVRVTWISHNPTVPYKIIIHTGDGFFSLPSLNEQYSVTS